jgi:uncharacterized protein
MVSQGKTQVMNSFEQTPPSHQSDDSNQDTSKKPGSFQQAATSDVYQPEGPAEQFSAPPQRVVRQYPPDLQISWSWHHLIIFVVFMLITLIGVQAVFFASYAPHHRMTTQELEDYMLSKPQVAIGSTLVVYALLLFFLYVTLAVLRGQPFWRTLGWRKIEARRDGVQRNPVFYFFGGCLVSLLVFALTTVIKTPENTPIEQVFKFKETAILFVAMAVLVAPLAEETLFRGYLYPMFARWFGVIPSVVVTGALFGLMHGPQLGDAKSLILIMSMVGIIFTAVRARTGSVFASYLMHLGYNSLIGISLLLSTHGFTRVPTSH